MQLRSILLGWLVVALVLAQSLALMHRVGHAPHAGPATAALHDHGHEHAHEDEIEDQHAQADGWLTQLFAAHGEGSSCRVFDQQGHGDAVPVVAPLVLSLVFAATVFFWRAGISPAAICASFDARGPPSAR